MIFITIHIVFFYVMFCETDGFRKFSPPGVIPLGKLNLRIFTRAGHEAGDINSFKNLKSAPYLKDLLSPFVFNSVISETEICGSFTFK